MKTVTPYTIRKKLNEKATTPIVSLTAGNNTSKATNVQIEQKKVIKIKDKTVICEDGTTAEMIISVPGIKVRCTITPNNDGISTLRYPLSAIILINGKDNYCLNLEGDTSDFEIIIDAGYSEFTVNDTFMNMKTDHLSLKGVEFKFEDIVMKKEYTENKLNIESRLNSIEAHIKQLEGVTDDK